MSGTTGTVCAEADGLKPRLLSAWRKRVVAGALLLAAVGGGIAIADNKPAMKKLQPGAFTLTTTPITSFGRGGTSADTGKLLWRGGLLLEAAHKNFGGWSGLVLEGDGRRFLAVSDAGAWMTGEITYKGPAPSGIAHARIGPLLAMDGGNLKRGRDRDAEAVALMSGIFDRARILVAFEQNARIAAYDFSIASGVSPTKGFLGLPDVKAHLSRNGGLEAMTMVKGGPHAGAVVVFAETTHDAEGNLRGWVLNQGRPALPIKLKDIGGYAICDVVALEDGSLIVLERRFSWLQGLYMRLRLLPAEKIGRDEPLAGEVLLEADLTQEIDNMEGLAVSRDANGTAILTLISDDNFNHALQRTLLLQFAYPGDPASQRAGATTAKARP